MKDYRIVPDIYEVDHSLYDTITGVRKTLVKQFCTGMYIEPGCYDNIEQLVCDIWYERQSEGIKNTPPGTNLLYNALVNGE